MIHILRRNTIHRVAFRVRRQRSKIFEPAILTRTRANRRARNLARKGRAAEVWRFEYPSIDAILNHGEYPGCLRRRLSVWRDSAAVRNPRKLEWND